MRIINNSVFENANGYERARIPGIVCTDKGTLVAYCELRRSDSDWAIIDIGMKKSTDGGVIWSERKILVSGENENTVNNPVMITDGENLHFLYCVNYKRVFYMKSTDEGESWSEPSELTDAVKEQTGSFFWSCIATGPTHGIKLLSGRLLVPIWLAFNKDDVKSHHPSVISLLYSDDNGKSWNVGKIHGALRDPSEFTAAQLDNGRVVANIRHEEDKRMRAIADITDNAEIINIRFAEALPDPVCCAGMVSSGNELLFSNCAHTKSRKMLTLKRLNGECELKDSLLLSEEAGYSDIAVSPDKKTAFILFEKEKMLLCVTVEI